MNINRHALRRCICFNRRATRGFNRLRLPPPLQLTGNWTSLISRWTHRPNYYHWLTDGLTRLALLGRLLAPDTRILVPARLRPFQMETLRWLGLEDRVVPLPGRHLLVEKYFFSAPAAMTGCANPYGVKFLREKFLPHAELPLKPIEKLHIQRHGKTRGLVNKLSAGISRAARLAIRRFGVAHASTNDWPVRPSARRLRPARSRPYRHAKAADQLCGGGTVGGQRTERLLRGASQLRECRTPFSHPPGLINSPASGWISVNSPASCLNKMIQ